MNRLLLRSRSADLDSPTSDGRPFADVPVAVAATPVATRVVAAASTALPTARLAPAVVQGKAPVPEGANAPSSTAPAVHLTAPPVAGILRTVGSFPVPHVDLEVLNGDLVPHVGSSDAGPSSVNGLPPSIAHYFYSKLALESGRELYSSTNVRAGRVLAIERGLAFMCEKADGASGPHERLRAEVAASSSSPRTLDLG
ncbi:hypothetical protein D1007_55671 [Hordeum vulgare]|nr:hypothetical protein D1007_55671 [Hordeum vulgare]